MEVDCGAAVSVINSVVYEKKFKHIPLMKCDRKLAVINGSRLNVEGQISVEVVFNGIRSNVKLIVLRCSSVFAPLLGRDWLDVFTPRWRDAFGISAGIKQLDVFQDHMVEKFKRVRWGRVYLAHRNQIKVARGGYTRAVCWWRRGTRECRIEREAAKKKKTMPTMNFTGSSPILSSSTSRWTSTKKVLASSIPRRVHQEV
ncbi:uncharacterized protein LOC119769020 [Culex quinquefasciatus]|uniref:uncharacterized protein LOC119769020 n=1 Tax=Culex quinquefasciatus TaxID=7176 RepID=UPI0018E2CDA0|nr:uncharacterized protein LOC119769020 [Culex quinquefasciatus]